MKSSTDFLSSLKSSMKGSCIRDTMKTKNFYVIVLFLLATVSTILFLGSPTPTLHTIVSETHKQINNIKNIPSNIRNPKDEILDVDPLYLHLLGFTDKRTATKDTAPPVEDAADKVAPTPVVGTSVLPGGYQDAIDLLISVKKYLSGQLVVLFDLGLSGKEGTQLRKTCNITKNNCLVKTFNFNKFPSHIKNFNTHSYRPLCIQMVLLEYGSVIWVEPPEVFLSGEVTSLVQQAKKVGVVAWTIKDPTSSLTHPKMFDYFSVKQEWYYFHRAVKSSHLIVFNTQTVHQEVMLPWVTCALVEECFNPTGAQDAGCSYRRKPLYLYSGCHKYDMSALNVVLGKLFKFNEVSYAASEAIFGKKTQLDSSGYNSTSSVTDNDLILSEV